MELNLTNDTIFLILKIVFSLVFALGLGYIFFELVGFPTAEAKKNLVRLSRNAISKPNILTVVINKLSNVLIHIVHINEFKRKRLISQFEILEMKITPEKYYADIYAKVVLVVALAPAAFLLHPVIGVCDLICGVLVFLIEYNKIDEIMQKRKEDIEAELPKFVSVIEQTFKNDHDVIKLIATYTESADTTLTKELKIALADMKTGDFETALNRLANRVNSVFLSETVRGLQSALHGDDTVGYFSTLHSKIWDNEKRRIKRAALKTPSKVKYLTKALLVCMFLIYVVVFGTVVKEQLGEIFTML